MVLRISITGVDPMVGIVIIAVSCWVIATFGYQVFHYYERWVWMPLISLVRH